MVCRRTTVSSLAGFVRCLPPTRPTLDRIVRKIACDFARFRAILRDFRRFSAIFSDFWCVGVCDCKQWTTYAFVFTCMSSFLPKQRTCNINLVLLTSMHPCTSAAVRPYTHRCPQSPHLLYCPHPAGPNNHPTRASVSEPQTGLLYANLSPGAGPATNGERAF